MTALKTPGAFLALLLLVAVVRGGVLLAMRGNLQGDPDAYREIAENLIRHGKFARGKPADGEDAILPTAYRPPLYPLLLSYLPAGNSQQLSLLKVALFHLTLGLATVCLTWLAAGRVGCGHKIRGVGARENGGPAPAGAGWSHPTFGVHATFWSLPAIPLVAAVLVAFDPILLHQQTLVMTETLAAFLAILALWCLARRSDRPSTWNGALAGGAIGLAVLCRPTFLPWLILVAAGYLGLGIWDWGLAGRRSGSEQGRGRGRSRALAQQMVNLGVLLAFAAAVVAPWVIRNYRQFGKPIATTTHGGYTLLLGNNRSYYQWLTNDKTGLPWDAEKNLSSTLSSDADELANDERSYAAARETIAHHRREFALASLYRSGQLWSPLPNQLTAEESTARRILRYATCGWYCAVYLLAALGVWKLKARLLRPPWMWGLLLCVAFTAVHTFYWTNLRMRAPLIPFVALVAAVGANAILVRKKSA